MKNKYQRMTKEEKVKIRDSFKESDRGKLQIPRLNRLILWGVLGTVVSLALVIYTLITKETFWNYIYAGLLELASIVFIVGSILIRNKEYNKFAIAKRK